MPGFWQNEGRTPLVYQKVKQAGKEGLAPFLEALNESSVARRGFWEYILDKDDFRQWRGECKKALIREAWYDGFVTMTHYPQAMLMTSTATSLSLFALSIVLGTSATLFTCMMVSGLICGVSYMMDFLNDDPSYTVEPN